MKLVGIMIHFKDEPCKISRFREQKLLTMVIQTLNRHPGLRFKSKIHGASPSVPPAHHVRAGRKKAILQGK